MSNEDTSLGESVLVLSTDGSGLKMGIEEAHIAALGLQKRLDEAQDHIKDRFAEKFQHVGIHLFGHDMLQAIGITEGARPVLGALSFGVHQLGEAFGLAAGPAGLLLGGMVALAAIGFKVYEGHEKNVEKLVELQHKQFEAFKTTAELKDRLEAYREVLGHLPTDLENVTAATKRLDEVQRQNVNHTDGMAMAAAQRSMAASRERIAALKSEFDELKNTQGATGAKMRSTIDMAAAERHLNERVKELNDDIAKQNALYETSKANIAERRKGYLGLEDAITKGTKAAKEQEEEEARNAEKSKRLAKERAAEVEQFDEFMARQSVKMMSLQEAEDASKVASVKKAFAKIRAEMDIEFQHEKSLINASVATQDTKDKQIVALQQRMETQRTAITKAEADKRKQVLAAELGIHKKAADDIAQMSMSALNNIADTASHNFAQMIVEGKSFTEAFKDFMKNMAEEVISDLIKIIIKQEILYALQTMTGTQGTGHAMGFPARARGGPVAAGMPYKVGEEGEELFVPAVDGTIIPHDQVAAGASDGGAGGTVVHQNFNIQGVDLSSRDVVGRVLTTAAALMRSGAVEAQAFARAGQQQLAINPRRAFA